MNFICYQKKLYFPINWLKMHQIPIAPTAPWSVYWVKRVARSLHSFSYNVGYLLKILFSSIEQKGWPGSFSLPIWILSVYLIFWRKKSRSSFKKVHFFLWMKTWMCTLGISIWRPIKLFRDKIFNGGNKGGNRFNDANDWIFGIDDYWTPFLDRFWIDLDLLRHYPFWPKNLPLFPKFRKLFLRRNLFDIPYNQESKNWLIIILMSWTKPIS